MHSGRQHAWSLFDTAGSTLIRRFPIEGAKLRRHLTIHMLDCLRSARSSVKEISSVASGDASTKCNMPRALNYKLHAQVLINCHILDNGSVLQRNAP